MRLWSSVWFRRLGIAALLALALGYVPYHLYGSSGLARYMRLKSERDALVHRFSFPPDAGSGDRSA